MTGLFARVFPLGILSPPALSGRDGSLDHAAGRLLNGSRIRHSQSIQSRPFNVASHTQTSFGWRSLMHIVAIVMAVLGGIAIWYWRLKVLGDAGREAVDFVGRARGAYRMKKFKKAAEGSVLATVDDPALGAAILLFTLARDRPAGTQPAETLVRFEIGDIVAPDRLDETLAYAEWAARSVADPRDCVRRFTDLWRQTLSVEERSDLIDMAENIAGPSPEPHQKLVIDALRNAIT